MADSARSLLTGWGLTAPTAADLAHPTSVAAVVRAVEGAGLRGVLPRGLGRSYGDAAQNAGGTVLDMTGLARVHHFDGDAGVVDVDAGLSLHALLAVVVPLGWFVAVTPGTRYVTVGGAIASDVHGKNHHLDGSFCDHVLDMDVVLASGEVVTTRPGEVLFEATRGALGLTGVVVRARLRLLSLQTSWMTVDTLRCEDLDAVMTAMAEGDDEYRYSVAWIDLMARGSATGRAVLTRGDHTTLDDLPAGRPRWAYRSSSRLAAPPWVPSGLLNGHTVRAFNEAYYRKAPSPGDEGEAHRGVESIPFFFHPLDAVRGWNRVYGAGGFLQYQYVVPFGAEQAVRDSVNMLSEEQVPSFLAVLKRFGEQKGLITFPMPGWTLALDIPARLPGLRGLCDRLDELVLAAGGRVYLSKDSRARPETIAAMYPRLEEWRAVRARVDPNGVFVSDLARRTGLV